MRRRAGVLTTDSRPRAVFLAPETPYPLAGGGALRSASLLHYLACRHDVDVIVFRQPGEVSPVLQFPPGLVRRISVIDLPPTGSSPAARGLRNARRLVRRIPPLVDRFSGFEAQITAAMAQQNYDIGVIEHFWCAPYWRQIARFCERTVLDLHNVESVWHERCAKVDGGAAALAHRAFARAARRLERACLPHFSLILTASECDAALARERAPQTRVTVYPNAIPRRATPKVEHAQAVVFSGNLEYHPNQSAVRFFRQQVWPGLRERWPELVWRLVGKNPHAVSQWTSGDPRIEVCGPVSDAIEELARAQIAVVPILAGSGTRLKILEAWAAGLPVVSTRIGAEGLPVENGRHLLLADTGAEFVETISELLESRDLCEQLGRAGRQLLENQFTWEKVWEALQI
jgi:glycosyltransferase involved in cell wall biosynthesis